MRVISLPLMFLLVGIAAMAGGFVVIALGQLHLLEIVLVVGAVLLIRRIVKKGNPMKKLLAVLLLTATPAMAQPFRSVEYFVAHPEVRNQFVYTCHGGISTPAHDAECVNAQRAGTVAMHNEAVREANKRTVGNNQYPEYYDAFPVARMMALQRCAHPVGDMADPTPQACQAARISAGRSR